MFEITYNDSHKLQSFVDCRKAYKDARYDFTFENRYIVYHCELMGELAYIALDMNTGYGSQITRRAISRPIKRTEYRKMLPLLFNATKYTGDSRYTHAMAERPLEVIDSIFRVILPSYGYTIREEQIKLAKDMYKGFTGKLVSINEAEVGTGKTLAYLVAALVAKHNNTRVYGSCLPITITTSSIELQKALVEKEIPNLSRMLQDFGILESPLVVALRKGKEHYFCRYRYEDFLRNIKNYPAKYGAVIQAFEQGGYATKAFDLDRLNIRPSIKEKICVKGFCRNCPYKEDCKYNAYVTAAINDRSVDIQVTNHNLYLTSQKMRSEINGRLLQSSAFIVIDEAHKFKDAAQEVFGARIDEKEVNVYLNTIKCNRNKSIPAITFQETMQECAVLNQKLFGLLQLEVNAEDKDEERGTIIELSPNMTSTIIELIETITLLEGMKYGKNSRDNRGAILLNKFKSFVRTNNINIWIEADENGRLSLCNTVKNIGTVLYKNVWDKDVSHVLTSGTMSDGVNFSFFARENGLSTIPKHLLSTTSTPSPFDYENHSRLYIPKDMPNPNNDSETYIKAIADKVVEIVEATNGHTAILFTSYKVLSAVYELVQERLSKYEIFRMTRKNNTVITDFKKSKNGVLFASGSMWEGVDCVGDCLSSVIIVRLPFPIRSATLEQKKDECEDTAEFIRKYAVPEMLIKLRQGAGRLIRTENDTGLVSILDSRALEGSYAYRVKKTLSKYPRVHSIEEIKEFFKEVKPDEYFN